MKLIKLEKNGETQYFTTKSKAANFAGGTWQAVNQILYGMGRTIKGWTVCEIDTDTIDDLNVLRGKFDNEPKTGEMILHRDEMERLKAVIANDENKERAVIDRKSLLKFSEKQNIFGYKQNTNTVKKG